MANTNPVVLRMFVTWLRRTFEIDESRLRVRLYLHEGLDLDAASRYWSACCDIPSAQFQQALPSRGRSHASTVETPESDVRPCGTACTLDHRGVCWR